MASDFLISFVQSLSGCKVTPGLYIVATPIGHLADITLRALAILSQVDFVVCEDTRVTGKLLQHYGIRAHKISHHSHNEKESTQRVLQELHQGKSVALVSDAGTPLVSDPGLNLIQAAIKDGISVSSVPGACAAVVGLSVSGLNTDTFTFVGFLPPKSNARKSKLMQYQKYSETLIMYEAPHRLLSMLTDVLAVFGNRNIAVARELTKRFEEVFRGSLSDAINQFSENAPKGEFVVMIEGCSVSGDVQELTDSLIIECLSAYSSKDAAATLAVQYGVSKKEVYQRILKLKTDPQP